MCLGILPHDPPPQAYKLRQVSATYIKPETQRLMLVLHVSSRGSAGVCAASLTSPCVAQLDMQ